MLHILCGKMASGKSTYSKVLQSKHKAILISEDIWLTKLFGEEIKNLEDYLHYSGRLKEVLFGHIIALLEHGSSVILDFPANTPRQRAWFKKIFETANVEHKLHYIVASDERCKQQLKKRNQELPEGSRYMSEEEFDMITSYFSEALDEEGFSVERINNEISVD